MNYYAGSHQFASRAAVKRYIGDRLEALSVGTRVADAKLQEVLNALASEHPRPQEKIGAGIEWWVVSSNADLHHRSGNKGFRIKQRGRVELVDFSYTKVLYPPSDIQQLRTALTEEARDITEQFRTDAFKDGPVCCIWTGELISKKTDGQAIHVNPPRSVLYELFLAQEGISVSQVALEAHPGISGKRLVDRDLAARWREFQHAHLDGMAIAKL